MVPLITVHINPAKVRRNIAGTKKLFSLAEKLQQQVR